MVQTALARFYPTVERVLDRGRDVGVGCFERLPPTARLEFGEHGQPPLGAHPLEHRQADRVELEKCEHAATLAADTTAPTKCG